MAPTNAAYNFALDVLRDLAGDLPEDAEIENRQLRGGLDASDVREITARFRDRRGRHRLHRTVLKELDGWAVREVFSYTRLVNPHAQGLSPELFGAKHTELGTAFLCLEPIRRATAWPWHDVRLIGDVLRGLGKFHVGAKEARSATPFWNFEGHLSEYAEPTIAAIERCRRNPDFRPLARGLPAVRRLALQQKRLAEQLFDEKPFGSGPIHGDVHSGNVLVRRRQTALAPVLIDWGRARLGSPLEDVSSWLQFLGFYEWEARRWHDTLLCDYLSAIGQERKLTSGVRGAYWIAGARNALAGALLHFICVAESEQRPKRERRQAYGAAQNWMRVVRNADAWSRN